MSRMIAGWCGILLACTASAAESAPAPRGKLFLIGGAERNDNRPLWDAFLQSAGGPGKTVAIFPTASRFPDVSAQERVDQFGKMGLKTVVIPLSPLFKTPRFADVAADPKWIAAVRGADAVFFGGGEQARILLCLHTAEGRPTPLLTAIREVFDRGGLIAGTSAGTAVMSRIMYRDAEFVLPTLVNGVTFGKEIDRGLGLLDERWIVDQHCLMKGRFARTLVPMRMEKIPFGIGIEEDTAVLVDAGVVRVVGRSNVLLLDASAAAFDPHEERFQWDGLRLSLLGHGDRINVQTAAVTPSAEKQAGRKVDPTAEDFDPSYLHKPFYNDILGNLTLVDAMVKVADNPNDAATGLAFDGRAARTGPTPGFEFHFTRDARTQAWESDAWGPNEYTILNMRLDIRPITIGGPLYK